MDLRPKGSAAVFILLGIFALSRYSEAQNLCSTPGNIPVIFISENNAPGAVVTTLTAQDGVNAAITSQNPVGLFSLNGYDLIADTMLDYETFDPSTPYDVNIECTKTGFTSTKLNVKIAVEDVNDNPPAFSQSQFTLNVDELSKVGTSVGLITATDPDKSDRLYYRMDPEGEFGLESNFNPNILVREHLDYDKIKQVTVTLYAQDTPLASIAEASYTATTTVVVNIIDIDNRPPWFQPCTEHDFGTSKVCVNSGYEGTVNLNEASTDPLVLKPGPLYAIDGDKGRNEPIRYEFLTGNQDGIFVLNTVTGSITVPNPVTLAGPFVLTVMAYQMNNPDQFATTTVILKVVESSNFPPTFEKPSYKGFISEDAGVDSMVLESKTSTKPLRVKATDKDFSDGYNPNLRFEVVDGSDFSITSEGFILMAKEVSPGTLNLEMRVVDTTNDESSTATLAIEVTPGVPTTTPATTTMTSSIKTTETPVSTTKTKPTGTTETATATTTTMLPPDSVTTTGGQQVNAGSGEFSSAHMAALGGSLAVVIVICLVCIALLMHRIKDHNTDWKKISEAGVFRSKLDGGSKEGVQYSNEGFQHDGDSGSVNSLAADLENKLESGLKPQEKAITSVTLQTTSSTPPDSSSLAGSETTDGEKEVKPILTKERRNEEGYKAVWFKEDIDPNTKEDVVIIPNAGEADEDHEEDDDTEDEDNLRTDMDSDDEEGKTSDL
ncbi:cadherin-related family member 5 isoform X1 [Labeo rohita]|uniref:cadherin-related family member 5 isoform X1 n=1 Tax=Labeo rohita TaxID=84645 RepID=UPI0021E2379F|nr:cadherin-related family member 5 isoform X1 [Labeo rohita]